jgi:hypothetical protein
MGYLEAVVVVYLRRLYYPGGFQFPLVDSIAPVLGIEIAREAATLLMILSVAFLGARGGWDRFSGFAFVMGTWDLAYYVSLRITTGWPASLATWDLLFLIPVSWVAPVWAPALIAALLIAVSFIIWRLLQSGLTPRVTPSRWAALVAGGALVIASFLWGSADASNGGVPSDFAWGPYTLGAAMAVAVGLKSWVETLRAGREPSDEGTRASVMPREGAAD